MTKIVNDLELHHIPDARFKGLAHRFSTLQTLEGCICFIVGVSPIELDGLLAPVLREIDGHLYQYGLNIEEKDTAEKVANFYINLASDTLLEEKTRRTFNKLGSARDFHEKVGILEAECDFISDRLRDFFIHMPWIDRPPVKPAGIETDVNHHYRRAYQEEKRKGLLYTYPFSDCQKIKALPNKYLNNSILLTRAEGSSDRRFELELLRWIDLAKTNKKEFDARFPNAASNDLALTSDVEIHRGGVDQPTESSMEEFSKAVSITTAPAALGHPKELKLRTRQAGIALYYLYMKKKLTDKEVSVMLIEHNGGTIESFKNKVNALENMNICAPAHSYRGYKGRLEAFDDAIRFMILNLDNELLPLAKTERQSFIDSTAPQNRRKKR